MRLVTVIEDGERHAGRLVGDQVEIVDRPGGLDALIAAGLGPSEIGGRREALAAVELDAPLRPPVILCAGQNYRSHLEEKAPVEVKYPEFFIKAGQTLAAPEESFAFDPRVTSKLDYETELGIVIGKAGRFIPAAEAFDHVFGYTVINDLTARDRQVVSENGHFSMSLGPGKNFDGSTRIAAEVIAAEEVERPPSRRLRTYVDEELRQSADTSELIFGVPQIIEYLSTLFTLRPGTVIATGTPGGTGWGFDPELGGTSLTPPGCAPGRYLRPGDTVRSEIAGIGSISFAITAPREEPVPAR
ncbi:MAG: fumarylacetoacetate hydrolase family protein [Actinobacteria bacterium]|nr:fumarylacetoacetate hydrolase family protein [Actinomycetota bacterium]